MKKSIKLGLLLIAIGVVVILGALAGGAEINESTFQSISWTSEVKHEEFDRVEAINVDLIVYGLEIVPSDSEKIYVEYNEVSAQGRSLPNSKLEFEVKDGVLNIKEIPQKVKFNFNFPFGNQYFGSRKITLSIPEKVAGRVHQEVGSFKAINVSLEDFTFTGEVGSLELIQVKTLDSKFDTETGSIKFKDSMVENIILDSEVGSITFSGTMLGDNEIESEVGSVNIELQQKRDDISLNLDSEIGSIKVGGVKGKLIEDRSRSENYLKVSTEVGSINIDFEK